jgi:hypothetical protein
MYTKVLLRTLKLNSSKQSTGRYGIPINRWQYHYANEDGIFEQDFNWIEQKRMPQPFPAKDFIYSHKGLPDTYPLHRNDVRYNFMINKWPRRHYVPIFKLKLYNFNDLDSVMHMMGWNDFVLDYQTEDPMESNHYVETRSQFSILLILAGAFIYIVCI